MKPPILTILDGLADALGRRGTDHLGLRGRIVRVFSTDRPPAVHAVVAGAHASSLTDPLADCPPLVRIDVNPLSVPMAGVRLEPLDRDRVRLELTVAAAEAEAFGPWLARFIRAREAGDKSLLPPAPSPLSMLHVEQDPFEFGCIWTRAARDLYERDHQRPAYRRYRKRPRGED